MRVGSRRILVQTKSSPVNVLCLSRTSAAVPDGPSCRRRVAKLSSCNSLPGRTQFQTIISPFSVESRHNLVQTKFDSRQIKSRRGAQQSRTIQLNKMHPGDFQATQIDAEKKNMPQHCRREACRACRIDSRQIACLTICWSRQNQIQVKLSPDNLLSRQTIDLHGIALSGILWARFIWTRLVSD